MGMATISGAVLAAAVMGMIAVGAWMVRRSRERRMIQAKIDLWNR